MMPDSVDLPDHLIGDSWSFEWDFSDLGEDYLDGLESASMAWRLDPDPETDPDHEVTLVAGMAVDGTSLIVAEFDADMFEEKTYHVRLVLEWDGRRRTEAIGEQRFFK